MHIHIHTLNCILLYLSLSLSLCVANTATRFLYGDSLYNQQVTPFASNSTIPLSDIVELEATLRLQPGILRILGASRVWDQDWGLPRVKCGTEGCNPTLCNAEGMLGYIVK